MKKVVLVKDASGMTIASQEIDPDDEGIPGEAILEDNQTVEMLESSGENTVERQTHVTRLLDDQGRPGDEGIPGEVVQEEGDQNVRVLLRDASGNAIASANIDPDNEDGIPCESCVEED